MNKNQELELINYVIEDLTDIINSAANEEDVIYRKTLLNLAKEKKKELEANDKVLKVPMRNGHNIVVYINNWYDEYPDDICVYFEHENVILQDITIIREHKTNDSVEVLVYAEDWNEDYTHKFEIKEHDFEEELK